MSKFGRNMRQWAEKVGAGVDKVSRAAVIDVSTRIIKRTPVDTGRARGNWIPSIGSPQLTAVERKTKVGTAVINDIQKLDFIGNIYYLTNNLPYIGRLEYQMWSKQAPNGMVRVSVLEFNAALKKAINEL